MSTVILIAKRSFTAVATARATIITTVVSVIIFLALGIGYRVLSQADFFDSDTTLALEPQTQPLAQALAQAKKQPGFPDISVVQVDSKAAAEEAVRDGDATYALVADGADWQILTADTVSPIIELTVNQLVQSEVMVNYVQQLGGSPRELASALAERSVTTRNVASGEDASIDVRAGIPALIVMLVVFSAIIMGGQTLTMSIVEEKSSRVVEIIVSTVRPLQLILGKVLGVGLFVLLQALLYVAAGFVAVLLAGADVVATLSVSVDIPILLLVPLPFGIVLFLTVAFLYSGLASTASRVEDTSGATSGPTILLVIGFYLPWIGVTMAPESPLLLIGSFLPVIGGLTAPVAYTVGKLSVGLLVASFAIQVVTCVVIVWLAAKVYQRQLLHFGARQSVWKVLRQA